MGIFYCLSFWFVRGGNRSWIKFLNDRYGQEQKRKILNQVQDDGKSHCEERSDVAICVTGKRRDRRAPFHCARDDRNENPPVLPDIPLYKGGFKRKLSFLRRQESIREKRDPESSSGWQRQREPGSRIKCGMTETAGTEIPLSFGHPPSRRGL